MNPDTLAKADDEHPAALAEVDAWLTPKESGDANPRANIQRPSMAQDIIKKRRTEIELMNGYVADKGIEIGVAAPSHARLTEIVLQVERGQLLAAPDHLGG